MADSQRLVYWKYLGKVDSLQLVLAKINPLKVIYFYDLEMSLIKHFSVDTIKFKFRNKMKA